MEYGNGEGEASRIMVLQKNIMAVLSQWDGLQMAVNNQWGGSDSLQKAHKLASDLSTSLSSTSKERVHFEDLENMLHESLLLTFNTEIEDGSIEEVAEQLMAIHEEYLHRHYY